jgi:broad specificity phosphatase PhoE
MGTVRLVLVRHGRTLWNYERRFLGATDLPLDPVGLAEADALAGRLGGTFGAIYSSPLSRARQTAERLAPPPILVLDALREHAQGALEGLDGAAALAAYPAFFSAFQEDPTDVRTPGEGGETLGEVRDRALAAVRQIAARHSAGQQVAVVSHQMVIATVRCSLAGEALASWRRYGLPNAGTAALLWDGAALRLE